MIKFINLKKEIPYTIFKDKYEEAHRKGQKNIEAVAISSYDCKKKEVESRFVNLKFVDDGSFIFFSNYKSPKSLAFESHNQISALLYWDSINIQIRMKSKISKTSLHFNKNYFKGISIKLFLNSIGNQTKNKNNIKRVFDALSVCFAIEKSIKSNKSVKLKNFYENTFR